VTGDSRIRTSAADPQFPGGAPGGSVPARRVAEDVRIREGVGAIVLAGGAGSRLGGVDKAVIRADGETLLDRALAALDGIDVVVVGPPRPGVRTVQEAPPRSGPAAAVVAGLAALPEAREVLLLAVDVPRLPEALPLLLDAAQGAHGVVAVDADGRTQWLLGRYRAAALRVAADRLGDATDRPLRALLAGLDLATVRLPPGLEADVDTVADARRAGVVLPGEETR
jgi:molybdopterin-guanine dinucleotide biosynthesis protein A